ncbi:MAG: chorismate mutase [Amphiplicatus sp.]
MPKVPKDCASMDEVRKEIDRIDLGLVDLLAERWRYVDRMWTLKRSEKTAANVPWRSREVIDKVRARAAEAGMPPEMAEALWRMIIGWGIQYQDERLREQADRK